MEFTLSVEDISPLLSNQNSINDSSLILITDQVFVDGSFLFLQMIHQTIRKGEEVLLICTENSTFHYSNVLKKLGMNTNEMNRVHFFNFFSEPISWKKDSLLTPVLNLREEIITIDENKPTLNVLVNKIQEKTKQKKMSLIVLDCINSLINVCENVEVIEFLQTCTEICTSVITLYHSCDKEEETSFYLHHADIIFKVEQLESGYSQHATGRIEVVSNRISQGNYKNQKAFLFKLYENGAKLRKI